MLAKIITICPCVISFEYLIDTRSIFGSVFRITRDADLDLDEDTQDVIEEVGAIVGSFRGPTTA